MSGFCYSLEELSDVLNRRDGHRSNPFSIERPPIPDSEILHDWNAVCRFHPEATRELEVFDGSAGGEKRADPDDGKFYTFEEVRARFRVDGFTEEETSEHWDNDCEPLEAEPAIHIPLPAPDSSVHTTCEDGS